MNDMKDNRDEMRCVAGVSFVLLIWDLLLTIMLNWETYMFQLSSFLAR